MDSQEAFDMMLPKDTKTEEEMRVWQAYNNHMYEHSIKALIIEQ